MFKEQRQLVNLVKKHGVDPENVAQDGMDHDGFDQFIRVQNRSGQVVKVMDGDKAMRVRVDWPVSLKDDPAFRPALEAFWAATLRHERSLAGVSR